MTNCINCQKLIPKKLFLGIKVTHNGKDIGAVCNDCADGVNGLRLFLKRDKGVFELKEMQIIPNPR